MEGAIPIAIGLPVAQSPTTQAAPPAINQPAKAAPPPPREVIAEVCFFHGLKAVEVPLLKCVKLRSLPDEHVAVLAYLLSGSGGGPPALTHFACPYNKRLTSLAPLVPALPASLISIDLSGPAVGRGILSDLTCIAEAMLAKQLPQLTAFLAPRNIVDDVSVEALARSVGGTPALRTLVLFQNEFSADAARSLVAAFRGRKEILLVDDESIEGGRSTLASHGLTDADLELLSATIRARLTPPEHLAKEVDLSKNTLQDGGCLFEALPTALPNITALNLSQNQFSSATFAAGALQKALSHLRDLRILDISDNPQLGDAPIRTICQGGVADAPSLRYLLLSAVGASDSGVDDLTKALSCGTSSLKELKLNRNRITDAGLAAIARMLASSSPVVNGLSSIELAGNPITPSSLMKTPPGLKALRAAGKANKTTIHL